MNILFLTDNYPPEVNAPATRTFENVTRWIGAGHGVTVLTCAPNFPTGRVFPGYRNLLLSVRYEDGVRVIRVWSYVARNAGFLKRIADYISYAVSASFVASFLAFDVIVATSPQFFTAVAGSWVATIRRKPWVFEVRDLWPESIKSVGAMKEGAVLRMLERLELFLYRQATRVVTVTNAFRTDLMRRGIRPAKIIVVPNGANTQLFSPRAKDEDAMHRMGLGRRPIIGYLGTHGMAHALDFVMSVARKRPDIDFVFIGDGAEKTRLQRIAVGIPNVHMFDSVPKKDVPRVVSMFDYTLVNLRDTPTFRTVIPSKIFEGAAMEVPILLGVDGEARDLVERYDAGVAYAPEDEKSFLDALDRAIDTLATKGYRDMQEGCRRLAQDYDRRRLADKMITELESVLA